MSLRPSPPSSSADVVSQTPRTTSTPLSKSSFSVSSLSSHSDTANPLQSLQERASPDLDLLACVSHNPRTASSWLGSKSTLPFVRSFPPPSSADPKHEPTSTLAPRASGHPSPTTRQREVYERWHNGMSAEEISTELEGTLKPLSVVWSLLGCVAGDSSLPVDEARLLASVEEVDGGSKWKMVEAYADVLKAAEERLTVAKGAE